MLQERAASGLRGGGPLGRRHGGHVAGAARQQPRHVKVHNLWNHQVPYATALAWQRALHAERVEAARIGEALPDDILLVVQHPPVLTLGTSSTLDNLRSDDPPFELFRTERGGEVTYHGPGQLVVYPVLDLRAYRKVSACQTLQVIFTCRLNR